jgi:multidrug efflux pump subunit AcrA (membrane-fusion protein)
MSQLGKYLLYVALAGGVAAAIAGYLLIQKHGGDAATLAEVQQAKTSSDMTAKKAQAEATAAKQAQSDAEAKATTANSKIDDLNTQLATAQKQAADATAAVQTANDATKAAQDKLDAITKTLNGKTADELVADAAKAESDLQAAQAEQKIIQDQLQASTQQIATLQDAINRSKNGGPMPGISGKVTFVDHAWNFVILDVGLSAGVVPNGELIVYRGRNFLGKVRVTKVDPSDSVAEILPDIKGDIQIGDAVLN